jgi:RES domain-containing protein
MPVAWRIVKASHAKNAFTGEGAAKVGGRWNSRGVPVVYASATQSLAALEILVHINPPVALRFRAFRIEIPDSAVEILKGLPPDWRSKPPPRSTRTLGDRWVREGRSAVLAVPSVLIPDEWNYLLNPAHPKIREIDVSPARDFALDPRLLR